MKVSELIRKLQLCDKNKEIRICVKADKNYHKKNKEI
jgi:hypothetical protein